MEWHSLMTLFALPLFHNHSGSFRLLYLLAHRRFRKPPENLVQVAVERKIVMLLGSKLRLKVRFGQLLPPSWWIAPQPPGS